MFPVEIYERILIYADGQTLLRANCVSKQWKQIVEYLENKYDIWERCSKKEIPKTTLYAMQDKCGYVDDIKHKWKVIYKNYQSWNNLRNKEFYVLPKQGNDYFERNMTCAKMSGSRIVYGNTNGIICVLNEQYEVEDVIMTDILGTIKDIIFINEVELKKDTAYNHSHALVVYERCFILLKLEPKIVQIAMKNNIMHCSVYNNIVAYMDFDRVIRIDEINVGAPEFDVLQRITINRVYGSNRIRSLCIYENFVTLITDKDVLMFDYHLQPASIAKFVHSLSLPYGIMEKYWTFHNNIVFCTASCYLYFSTINSNGNIVRVLNSMPVLQSPICDIFLYGHILLISTLSGVVYIYVVDDWSEFELKNFDLKINVYGEPITSIDVQELENEHRLLLAMNDNLAQVFIY